MHLFILKVNLFLNAIKGENKKRENTPFFKIKYKYRFYYPHHYLCNGFSLSNVFKAQFISAFKTQLCLK